jgi:hypothetical protein
MTDRQRFSVRTHDALVAAGWHPGRKVHHDVERWRDLLDTPGSFQMFPRAREVLLEFGGLRVEQAGPGVDCARAPFHVEPTLALGESDRFRSHEATVGARLYPLGEAMGGHAFLAMAEDGRIFFLMDDTRYLGPSFDEALESLIEGKLPKEM